MSVLIVEDERVVAMSLRVLLQAEGRFKVVAIADDLASAVTAADQYRPQVALVDIQLARGASGFDVASALQRRGIACIFMTGNPPEMPRPDLTIGCLSKPFSDNALFETLEIARQVLAGDRPPATALPAELTLY